ncbi:MAG: hypothetical protein WBV92_06675 [Nitrosotalea sp.]
MKIINSNPLFLLTKLSRNTRIFIAISSIACYGLFLYELLPEYLFNISFSLYYFILPLVAIIGILVVVPKVMTKDTPKPVIQNYEQIDSQSEQAPEMTSFAAPKQESGIIQANGNDGGIISDIILPTPEQMPGQLPQQAQTPSQMSNPTVVHQPVVDESILKDMVTKAVDPFQRELTRMQDIISDVRSEINSTKSIIQDLTLTFETSLTDLKAFQAEIANPLNFMRKYFDSIDIKNLSDPTLPLYSEQSPVPPSHNSNVEISHSKKESDSDVEPNQIQSSNEESNKITMPKQGEEERHESELHDTLPFKQLFSGSLTLGKLMNTTTVLEEILQTVDRDSIDMLIEQCKLMGLKQEDEHVIYNIINMMDQSGLSVKEILVMLYKFGKVMGISDKEADLVYAKLMMSQGKTPSHIVTVESKGN